MIIVKKIHIFRNLFSELMKFWIKFILIFIDFYIWWLLIKNENFEKFIQLTKGGFNKSDIYINTFLSLLIINKKVNNFRNLSSSPNSILTFIYSYVWWFFENDLAFFKLFVEVLQVSNQTKSLITFPLTAYYENWNSQLDIAWYKGIQSEQPIFYLHKARFSYDQ